jgi:hypothetical protein
MSNHGLYDRDFLAGPGRAPVPWPGHVLGLVPRTTRPATPSIPTENDGKRFSLVTPPPFAQLIPPDPDPEVIN